MCIKKGTRAPHDKEKTAEQYEMFRIVDLFHNKYNASIHNSFTTRNNDHSPTINR